MNFLGLNPMAWVIPALLACRLADPAQPGQKEQQPRFGVRVNLVSLDVEVLDPKGNPVMDLTKEDFIIRENSRPVEITNFAWMNNRPVSLAMVLDTSAISADKLVQFKHFIRELANVLAPTDDLCLYSFDSRDAYLEMDFTARRGPLQDALDNIGVPSHGTGGFMKELFGTQPRTGLAIDMALNKLRNTTNGKKALLLISNRFRGLGPATVEHVQESGSTLLTLGYDNKAALLITLGGDQISKRQLMKESGGRTFSANTDDVGGVCRKIAFSLKNYYSLGYLTEITPDEKKPRRLEVQVPGHSYTINYRRTYIAN